ACRLRRCSSAAAAYAGTARPCVASHTTGAIPSDRSSMQAFQTGAHILTAVAKLRGGIDLGGTKIQTAIVDSGGKVLGEARQPTPTAGAPTDVADAMASALREAAEGAGGEPSNLDGVGGGSPGHADEKTADVAGARNLPGWNGSFPLGKTLSDALGTTVKVGNDVQVATEAEFHLGAAREFTSLLGVFWGTGVGGGLILDGKPWLGRGAAGEI